MLSDLRLALRWLRRSPGFTAVAVLTLSLAIGANAAIFSVADAVLFRPLPYSDADRLVTVRMQDRATGDRYTLVPTNVVQALHDEHGGVGEVARIEEGPPAVHEGPQGLSFVETASVTANYFQVLGVRAHRGRVFAGAGEDGGARAAMLSFRAWRDRFGGDDAIAGQALTLGTQSYDIVGVLPPGFLFPSSIESSPELITILQGSIGQNPYTLPSGGAFFPIVRLEPGVTITQAQSELETMFRALGEAGDQTVPTFEPVRSILNQTGGPIMRYMLAGSLLLLLLGCANLANVLLARAQRRERETGVRAALGATRLALLRPVVLESVLLGLIGSLVAVVVARLAFYLLIGSVPPEAYLGAEVGVDGRVMAFTLALGMLAILAFGVSPAWRAGSADATQLIQRRTSTGGPRRRLGAALVALQVAAALVLVFGASITGRAFLSLLREPIGFTPDDVLTVSVGGSAALPRGQALQALLLRVMDEVARVPGVERVGATSSLPRIRGNAWAPVHRPGTQAVVAAHVHALPGYFDAAGIPLLAGRDVTADEARASAPVAVVSQRAAQALFPGRDPIGSSFTDARGRSLTVVGVVADIRQFVARDPEPLVYAPTPEAIRLAVLNLVVRASERNAQLAERVRQRVTALVPGVVVTTGWWEDRINALAAYRNPRFQTMVLGAFAAIALGLTALGVFGVVSVMVAMRTREIGIRMALGSTPRTVVSHSVRRSLAPVIAGIVVGLLATRWLAQLAESQLYQVDTGDPMVLAMTCSIVLLAGIVAAWVPSRRAGRVDPVVALRSE
jgi:putative ABC transport system permease protein